MVIIILNTSFDKFWALEKLCKIGLITLHLLFSQNKCFINYIK